MASFRHTVLQVVPSLNAGGAERTTADIAEAISRSGGRAIIATSGGFLEDAIAQNGGDVLKGPYASKNPWLIWKNAARLCEIIKAENVDLIHARSRAPAWSALWAARRSGIPFVTTHHRGYMAAGPVKSLYNSSLLRADLVIANSKFTASAIAADNRVNSAKVRVIPRGVNLAVFDPEGISRERIDRLATDWGMSAENAAVMKNDGLRVLLPARLTKWKGHITAIRALADIKSEMQAGNMQKLTLVFCGGAQDGEGYEASLRTLVNELGVRDMVHFVGECADMPAAYGWADVVLSPSIKPESFGRAPIEAGAMKKIAIASNHGGARETVCDGVTGILTPPSDEHALGAAIKIISQMTPHDRIAMGERARQRVIDKYSVATMATATLDAYRDVIAEWKN